MFIRILNTYLKLLSTWQLQLGHSRLFTPSIRYYIQHKSRLQLELKYDIITVSHACDRGMIPEEDMHIFRNFICCITLLTEFRTPLMLDDRG